MRRDTAEKRLEEHNDVFADIFENQSGIDNTMPERVMGYDYAAYEEQIQKICEENAKAQNPAYTKRIHDDQRLAPVITAVLHYGTQEKWASPLCLHDMLEFPEKVKDIIKPYVADYPINIINVSCLSKEARERLTSDFRLIADYLACKKILRRGRNLWKIRIVPSVIRRNFWML